MHNEFTLPHDVFEDIQFKELGTRARLLYCYLGKLKNRFQNGEGWFWRSIPMLSEDTNWTERTVRRAKKELEEGGFIEVARGKYKATRFRAPNWYRLNGFDERAEDDL